MSGVGERIIERQTSGGFKICILLFRLSIQGNKKRCFEKKIQESANLCRKVLGKFATKMVRYILTNVLRVLGGDCSNILETAE
jgi:hypothetical protein